MVSCDVICGVHEKMERWAFPRSLQTQFQHFIIKSYSYVFTARFLKRICILDETSGE